MTADAGSPSVARPGRPIHARLVGELDLVTGQVLVDLGCGDGGTLLAAATAVVDLGCVGFDLDPSVADELNTRTRKGRRANQAAR